MNAYTEAETLLQKKREKLKKRWTTGIQEEMDCWNPNCGNKAESEDSLTCADCTSARETTEADICIRCDRWVDAAKFDQDNDPFCDGCYERETYG